MAALLARETVAMLLRTRVIYPHILQSDVRFEPEDMVPGPVGEVRVTDHQRPQVQLNVYLTVVFEMSVADLGNIRILHKNGLTVRVQRRIVEESHPIANMDRAEGKCIHYGLVGGTQVLDLCLVADGQVRAQHELEKASLHELNVKIFAISFREANLGARHLNRR